jgi:dynein heavy chain 1
MASSPPEEGEAFASSGTGLGFDVGVFRSYLGSLLPPVMAASRSELEHGLFDDPAFEEKALRFATDAGCQVVYVTKQRYHDADEDDQQVVRIGYRLHLPPTPPHSSDVLSTLALIKTTPTLDSLAPLGAQLHFMQLSSSALPQLMADIGSSGPSTVVSTPTAQSTPYDGLHSLVHWGVAPWFDSYVASKGTAEVATQAGKKNAEAQMGIPITKKKFAELELSLLHLKQNVEIPEVHLSVHPAIRKAVALVSV